MDKAQKHDQQAKELQKASNQFNKDSKRMTDKKEDFIGKHLKSKQTGEGAEFSTAKSGQSAAESVEANNLDLAKLNKTDALEAVVKSGNSGEVLTTDEESGGRPITSFGSSLQGVNNELRGQLVRLDSSSTLDTGAPLLGSGDSGQLASLGGALPADSLEETSPRRSHRSIREHIAHSSGRFGAGDSAPSPFDFETPMTFNEAEWDPQQPENPTKLAVLAQTIQMDRQRDLNRKIHHLAKTVKIPRQLRDIVHSRRSLVEGSTRKLKNRIFKRPSSPFLAGVLSRVKRSFLGIKKLIGQ